MKDLRECRECGRMLPRRSYRRVCASCIKRAAGFEQVRIAAHLRPGFVTVYRSEWRKKEAAA